MSPRFSFVLAVHGDQAYLDQCASSVLGQEFADLELIAIDDASPDHGPALLDGIGERDGRVRVEHLPQRVGPGRARNLGLELASGDHVWFLNATDMLPGGALATVAERLRVGDADVLVVPHTRVDVLGHRRPGRGSKLIAAAAQRGPGAIDEQRRLAATATRVWDKLFRRELLSEAGARFGDSAHSGLTVTWPALLAAARIDAVAEPAYLRREPPNATPEPGSPFDVFAQYDALFELMEQRDDTRTGLVVPAMVRHELSLLATLPDAERREFFQLMSQGLRAHGRGDERLGRNARLVHRDAYAAFRTLEQARVTRDAVSRKELSKRRGRLTKRLRRSKLERHYSARLRQPLDPQLAAYGAYWYRGYACNPRAVYERARELAPDVRGVWIVKPEGVAGMPAGVDHVVAGTPEYYDLIARASYLVNNVNFPNHLVKREGSAHVMTHHGTPLKRMGLDLQDAPGKRADFAALMRRSARWDYSVTQNAHTSVIWERVYPVRCETLEVGYPRNDELANATAEQVRGIRAELGIEPGRRSVLYAPTHREYQTEYVPTLDLATVAAGLGPDHLILARLHYFYGADPVVRRLQEEGRLLDVSGHPSIEELMLAADVLVTDYSSMMFDYAVLDRPIVIHAPDWETYRSMRGAYFDLITEGPGAVTGSDAQLIDALRSGRAFGEDAERARAAFRARFCSLEDGRAAERVVRRVFLGEREAAAVQPARAVAR